MPVSDFRPEQKAAGKDFCRSERGAVFLENHRVKGFLEAQDEAHIFRRFQVVQLTRCKCVEKYIQLFSAPDGGVHVNELFPAG